METIYKINPELDIPIYQQLVDAIGTAIKKGVLESGEKLPTVQEVTDKLGIARGTIKRAYDELERAGMIEKVQGRGTFVSYRLMDTSSRKEQAMIAIEEMLGRLENMGFSPTEINIFLNLKLRERSEEEAQVKIAVVECNPENLSQMSEQLRHIPGVDLYSYLIEDVQRYPYKLSDGFDLIVSTASHIKYLESVLPVRKKRACVALRESARWLSRIIRLHHRERVGIISYSQRFGDLLYKACETYAESVIVHRPICPETEGEVMEYINGKDIVLVPRGYEKYFKTAIAEEIRRLGRDAIECYYEMDEGSLIYLEAKIKRMLEEKTI